MMKMKKLISSLLAVLMLVASLNITLVSAADYTELELDYVDKVQAANIMTGTENGMDLDSTLTRAQAATIMIRLKGVAGTGNLPTAPTKFSDVPADHWASGNINRAVEMGLVKGTTDTTFAPEALVTIAELTTMAVRAVGAGTAVELLPTAWPVNYMNFAAENDITKNIYNSYTEKATRMVTAIIAGNTLEVKMWKYNSVLGTDKGLTQTTETLLENVLKYDWYKNVIVTDVDLRDRIFTGLDASGNSISFEVAERINLAAFAMGQEVDVWYNRTAKEIVRIGLPEATKRTVVAFESIESFVGMTAGTGKDVTSIKLVINGKEKEYSFAPTGVYSYNGVSKTWDDSSAGDELKSQDFRAMDSTKSNAMGRVVLDGNKIKVLEATVYDNAIVVDRVSGETIYANSDALENSGATLNLKDKDVLIIDAEGKELKVTDIKAGDFILYTITTGTPAKYRLMVINNSVEGKVATTGTTFVKIGTKTYEIDRTVLTLSAFAGMGLNADDEATLYLNAAGKIVAIKKGDGEVSTSYAIVTWAKGVQNKYGEYALEIELTYFDGTTTGVKEIDTKKTDDHFAAKYGDPAFANVAAANTLGAQLLGQVVKFKNGTKIELTEVSTTITGKWAAADDKLDSFTSANVDVKNNRITGTGLKQTARVNSSTVIASIKAGTGTDATYKNKVEFMDWSALKDNNYTSGSFVSVAQNNTTGIISALVFGRGVNVSKDYSSNYGFVKAISDADRNDIVTLALLTPDGLKEFSIDEAELPTEKMTDKMNAGVNWDVSKFVFKVKVGTLVEYTASGSTISEIRAVLPNSAFDDVVASNGTAELADFAKLEYQVVNFNSNTLKVARPVADPTKDDDIEILDLAKNVIYVKSDIIEYDRSAFGDQDEITTASLGLNTNNKTKINSDGSIVNIYMVENEVAIVWYKR